jgi:predicted O-methyltransferase YrrM
LSAQLNNLLAEVLRSRLPKGYDGTIIDFNSLGLTCGFAYVAGEVSVFEKNANNLDDTERFVRAVYRGLLRREPDDIGLASWLAAISNGMTPAQVVEEFINSDEYQKATAIKMFVPPGHFYSPIVDPVEADHHLRRLETERRRDSLREISIDRNAMVRKWNELVPLMKSAPFSESPSGGLHYAYDNPSYSLGDAAILHAMLRLYQPKRLIEIGSGYSSACTLDTVERYLNSNCQLTFIEPYPELLIKLLGEAVSRVRIIDRNVQQAPAELFEGLSSGDILFVDSTHVLKTGSDVCFELFEILPRLAKGVLVHFHDMFWPFEYPREWAIDDNRSWNELYAVRAFLTQNNAWQIVMFNSYMAKFERPMIEATFPEFLRNSGGALWLQRK